MSFVISVKLDRKVRHEDFEKNKDKISSKAISELEELQNNTLAFIQNEVASSRPGWNLGQTKCHWQR